MFQSIREVGWDSINIFVIDKIVYNSNNEALDMETKYMTMFDAQLNMVYPQRIKKNITKQIKKEFLKGTENIVKPI